MSQIGVKAELDLLSESPRFLKLLKFKREAKQVEHTVTSHIIIQFYTVSQPMRHFDFFSLISI